jgi:hypothetical protein
LVVPVTVSVEQVGGLAVAGPGEGGYKTAWTVGEEDHSGSDHGREAGRVLVNPIPPSHSGSKPMTKSAETELAAVDGAGPEAAAAGGGAE